MNLLKRNGEKMQRTVQDFVEDMVSDGRGLDEILIVAINSRWSNQMEEIKKEHHNLKKRSVLKIR